MKRLSQAVAKQHEKNLKTKNYSLRISLIKLIQQATYQCLVFVMLAFFCIQKLLNCFLLGEKGLFECRTSA